MQDMCLQTSDDNSLNGTSLGKWQEYVKEATRFTGVSWTNVPNYRGWFEEAGFVDVEEVGYRWPSNQWSGVRRERLLGACELCSFLFFGFWRIWILWEIC